MQWKGNVEEGLLEHANSTDAFISNPRAKWEIKSIELQSPPVHEHALRVERWALAIGALNPRLLYG